MKKPHEDQALFLLLCNNSRQGVQYIYDTCYPLIEKRVLNNSGTKVDAEDIFQEGLMGLLDYRDKEFILEIPLCHFMYSVCRRQWLRRLKKKPKKAVTFIDNLEYTLKDHILSTEEEKELKAARLVILYKHLNKMEPHEQQVIRQFHFEKMSMKEIAVVMDFSSENSAKVQKSKYLKKLRTMVRNDPDFE